MTGRKSNADLLIVGSVAFDSIQTLTGGVDKALGGSATYASLAASYFAASRVVGIVGRLVPVKNHELMLDAFARLCG